MSYSTLIGSIGVSLLLIAFFLNLFGFLSQKGKGYILLNMVGAGLSGYASILIHYIPFVILEGAWFAIALAGLVKNNRAS